MSANSLRKLRIYRVVGIFRASNETRISSFLCVTFSAKLTKTQIRPCLQEELPKKKYKFIRLLIKIRVSRAYPSKTVLFDPYE